MQIVTVFLRTPLFSYGAGGHIPAGVMVIEGEIIDRPRGALQLATRRLLDGSGTVLTEEVITITLPWSKVDHILEHVD